MLLSLTFRFIIRFSIIREKAGRVKEFAQKIGTDFVDKRICRIYHKNIKRRCPVTVRPYVTKVTATSCSDGWLLLFVINLDKKIANSYRASAKL
ncbi:MAG: hypothetical protein LUG45_03875 [Clostridiales bacterium]|nr:hypothetical protein [Clostridiales bacterium]